MRQLTFRIDLPDQGAYALTLLASDDGDPANEVELATATIPEPFELPQAPRGQKWPTPDELKALLGGAAPKSEYVLGFAGRALAAVMETGRLAASWEKELLDAWDRRGDPIEASLRVVLRIQPPELTCLPWELALPSTSEEPLARQLWTTLARRHQVKRAARGMDPLKEPLRFLIIVGCKENDTVQWQEELHHLLALTAPRLHAIDFELFITHRLRTGPLLERLGDTISEFKPHIVHFIGHGEARTALSQAALMLHDVTDADAKRHFPRAWRVGDITGALAASPPRLVVLNACRTSEFAGTDGVYGVAESLLGNGVAAVVGMQGDIPAASAAVFASGFYGALLSGSPIDQAMVKGRQQVVNRSGATERDWALPVLLTGVPIADVLKLAAVDDSDSTLQVRNFVDRRPLRRSLRASAESAARSSPKGDAKGDAKATHPGLLIVRGESTIGKTTLVKYALEGCTLRGRTVRYVSFDKTKSMNIIDVLRHIRGPREDDVGTPTIERSLYAKFARFNDALKALLRGDNPPDVPGDGEDDPNLRFVEGTSHPATMKLALEAFRECLRTATQGEGGPLVIALDDIGRPGAGEGISVEYFSTGEFSLAKALLAPIAERKTAVVGDVRCVICASKDEEEAYSLGAISREAVGCDVAQMPSDDFDLLGREYLLQVFRTRNLTHADVSLFVDSFAKFFKRRPSFMPIQLKEFAETVQSHL